MARPNRIWGIFSFRGLIAAICVVLLSTFFWGFWFHIRPSSDDKYDSEYVYLKKDTNWREQTDAQSIRSLFSKEVLDIINASTSDLRPWSVESLRKREPSLSWVVEEDRDSVETSGHYKGIDPDFGHEPWIGDGLHLFNDTTANFQRSLKRQKRRKKLADELMSDKSIHELETEAFRRSRYVDSVPLGNYSIWKGEYNKKTIFRDLLSLMQDQITMARVYSGLAKMTNNLVLHEQLETQQEKSLLELDAEPVYFNMQPRILDAIRDMGQVLIRANEQRYGCDLVIYKLSAMVETTNREIKDMGTENNFTIQLVSKELPKLFRCLSMRLTLDYFELAEPMRKFPREENLENPDLYHYALFSDNILATSVVINSTVMNAKDPSKHVFHLMTNEITLRALRMWFILNPPGNATMEIQSYENIAWLNSSYCPAMRQAELAALKDFYFKTPRSESGESAEESFKFRSPKYISMLNHLRFYIPQLYPKLEKILFFDEDIVVQKDLTPLWSINLEGKVNGAVETCGPNFHHFHNYLNFNTNRIPKSYDPQGCGWGFGMNILNLKEWRKNNSTETYHFWQNLNEDRALWKLGTLPPALLVFYNLTLPIDKKWHTLKLGYEEKIEEEKVENSAVIHYNGHKKPWQAMALTKWQHYWKKYINFDDPYITSCKLYIE